MVSLVSVLQVQICIQLGVILLMMSTRFILDRKTFNNCNRLS